jgi:cAMP-dependent protein kinase regulator
VDHPAGATIIRQADEGDNFYVVESGRCKCYQGARDESGLVATCNPGDCFGELALMYNSPRAATVVADTDCSLWALDRASFSILLMQSALNRRAQNQDFLEYVVVLSTLSSFHKGMLADALEPCSFESGTVIIKQGDPSSDFFIVQEGEVVVSQLAEGAETPTTLETLHRGDYFGCVERTRLYSRAAGPLTDVSRT